MTTQHANQQHKQEAISQLFKHGVLVTPDILKRIEQGESVQELLGEKNNTQKPTNNQAPTTSNKTNIYTQSTLPLDEQQRAPLHITYSYQDDAKKYGVQDFVALFNRRFEAITNILRTRSELEGLTAIRRLSQLSDEQKRNTAIIAYVLEKQTTKNGHLMLTVEDKSGIIRVLVNKDRAEVADIGQQLVHDDIIGIKGAVSDQGDLLFANNIVFPDVPIKELTKSPFPVKAAFTSDIHYGAKLFMHNAFNDFIAWINGETTQGKEREEVMKIKYLFLPGDLVEGVGVYPGQENDLAILDVKEQYIELAKKLKEIRKDIHIIACGGNHDAMRIAEPQPPFYHEYCQPLYELENFTAVSSPSVVTIGRTKEFVGLDILMYHGYSFPYYFDGVEYLRQQGGIDRIDLVMEFLLKRRHLAPAHTSTQYVPDTREDPLVIKKVPDIFATGHVHKTVTKNYKNVTMLNCSAWFGETDYMIKRGIIAEPARVIVVDAQTRDIEVKNFEREDRS